VGLSLVSIDSTTARAHHDAAGTHLDENMVTALEKAAAEEETARSKGAASKNRGGRTPESPPTGQSGKGLAALDEHQVRRYASWSRWVTLAMLAHAFLAVVRADEHTRPAPDALIPLTCNEIQRLFITLVVRPVHDTAHRLGWSDWRRRHQARSQASHYRRQATQA
jgi:hypothetical protein